MKDWRRHMVVFGTCCTLGCMPWGPGESGQASPRGAWAPPAGELHDVGLRVRTIGAGPPSVVLLHGLAGSNRYFGAAFDALARDARLVVPDLLGFGESPRPDHVDYGPEAHARAVLDALRALKIDGPLYLVGHSAGSLVALRMAALEPERVRGIVSFGPPFYRSESEARARIQALGSTVRLFAMDTLWAGIVCKALYPFHGFAGRLATRIRSDLPPEIAKDALKHSWASYSGTVRRLLLAQPPLDLHTLRVPVRLIAGAEDEILDLEHLKELSQDKHIKLDVWPGDHDLPLTEAGKSVDLVHAMLRQDT